MLPKILTEDWHVIGRADIDTRRILVECQQTGRLGYVLDFTEDQWERAESAVINAYRWNKKWGEITELTASVA